MKKISCLFILSLLINFSCKKYPDGPTFSLRSPSQRIIGAWKLKVYMINGTDSINIFSNYNIIPGMDFKDPGINDTSSYLIRGGMDTNIYVTNIGLYELKNKKTELVLTSTKIVNSMNLDGPLMSSAIIIYKILRLKQNELWLQTDFSGSSYELHYER
ncbi:hypothetical protein LBMAG27_14440 [Bacteroidota bacterium]|nr:hypothetical protein LBMAG27_14440 [Bacteroidota bacterium]